MSVIANFKFFHLKSQQFFIQELSRFLVLYSIKNLLTCFGPGPEAKTVDVITFAYLILAFRIEGTFRIFLALITDEIPIARVLYECFPLGLDEGIVHFGTHFHQDIAILIHAFLLH